jgi:hypothetical protein
MRFTAYLAKCLAHRKVFPAQGAEENITHILSPIHFLHKFYTCEDNYLELRLSVYFRNFLSVHFLLNNIWNIAQFDR